MNKRIRLGGSLGLVIWLGPGFAAEPAGADHNWLRLEQRGERQRLQTEQSRYRDERAGETAAAAVETERRLQLERLEQDRLFELQLQDQMQLEQRRRATGRDNATQHRGAQQQRVQQQNRQLRLHQDLQRRARPGASIR